MNYKKIYVALFLSATMNQLNSMINQLTNKVPKVFPIIISEAPVVTKMPNIYNQQQSGGLLHNQPPNASFNASFWNTSKIKESIDTLKNLTKAVKNKDTIFDLTKEEIAQILSFGLMNPPGMFELIETLKNEQYDYSCTDLYVQFQLNKKQYDSWKDLYVQLEVKTYFMEPFLFPRPNKKMISFENKMILENYFDGTLKGTDDEEENKFNKLNTFLGLPEIKYDLKRIISHELFLRSSLDLTRQRISAFLQALYDKGPEEVKKFLESL